MPAESRPTDVPSRAAMRPGLRLGLILLALAVLTTLGGGLILRVYRGESNDDQLRQLDALEAALMENDRAIANLLTRRLLESGQQAGELSLCVLHPATDSPLASVPEFLLVWDARNGAGAVHQDATGMTADDASIALYAQTAALAENDEWALVFDARIPATFDSGVFRFAPETGEVRRFKLTWRPVNSPRPAVEFLGQLPD